MASVALKSLDREPTHFSDRSASGDRAAPASLRPGDRVLLAIESQNLVVKDSGGSTVGTLEPRLASRLMRLMRRGNSYEAGILSSTDRGLTMLIREAKHADESDDEKEAMRK